MERVCVIIHLLLYKLNNMQAWLEKGLNPKGYLVCKFAFKVRIFRSQRPYKSHRDNQRLLNQPALPIRDTEDTVHDNSDIKQGEEDETAAALDDSDIERDE